MEAYVFDLFETQVNTAQLQPFQFNNVTYAIDSIEIEKGIMNKLFRKKEKTAREYSR